MQGLNGEWVSATPIPNTIVVNIGDLMSFWSGGRYKATKHRVRFNNTTSVGTSSDRYSVAMFMHPNRDTRLVPFKSSQDEAAEENSSKGGVEYLTAGEYVQKRFAETYTK